jgi:hypothetical protein
MYSVRPRFRLEGRLLLHGGGADSPLIDASSQVSTAADVFQPQMGRIWTAAQVFQAHLSRSEIAAIIASQLKNAYFATQTGLSSAMSAMAASGDSAAFEADLAALCAGLDARCAEMSEPVRPTTEGGKGTPGNYRESGSRQPREAANDGDDSPEAVIFPTTDGEKHPAWLAQVVRASHT